MEKFILIVEEVKFNGMNWEIEDEELENIQCTCYEEAKNKYNNLMIKYKEYHKKAGKNYFIQLICNEDDFDKRNKDKIIGAKGV